MGSIRLAFLKRFAITDTKDKNNVITEDHIVMEMSQSELLDEFKAILNMKLSGKDGYTKQDIWNAIDHAATELVADFKRQSVRIL